MSISVSRVALKGNQRCATHEFELGGSSSDIALLVWGSGWAGSVPVVGTIALGLGTTVTGSRGADTSGLGALGALVRRRHDLGRQVQVGSQVFCALVCEVPRRVRDKEMELVSGIREIGDVLRSPVIVAPGELFLDEATGLQRLHGLDDVQVGHLLQLGVLGGVGVLLGHHDSLLEEELIDSDTMLLGHKHPAEGRERETGKRLVWVTWVRIRGKSGDSRISEIVDVT